MPTGVPNLDEILGGGLPQRTLTLVIGVPGAGKTILAAQMAVHRAVKGERAIIFTAMSESHEQLLAGLGEFSFADETLIGNALRFYSIQSVLNDGLPDVVEMIIETVRRERATFVVLDGFHGITGFAESDRDVNVFLYSLRSRLALFGATVVVTYETDAHSPNGAGTLTIADGIVVMHNRLDNERHHRWIEISKMRGMAHLDGLHTFAITQDGITTYPRHEAVYHTIPYTASDDRAEIGFPELDEILAGGLNRNTVTFLAGSPGTGKTLTALRFLMTGVAAGEPGLYVGLAEGESQIALKARYFGMDFAGAVEQGTISLLHTSPAVVDVDILAAILRDRVESLGIRRLVIDPIAVVEAEIPFRQRAPRYLASLFDYLREHGVTVIVTQESSVSGTGVVGDAMAATLVDSIVLLQWVEYRNTLVRILSVRKMRQSGFDTTLREYRIADGTVRVLPIEESGTAVLEGITAQEQRENRHVRQNRQE